jgi:MinD superfamily P-loop ATPase
MKQLTVISGKGGTGKTTLTAAFASLTENAVFADCDVDAADLHLILKPDIKKTQIFTGLKVAVLDNAKCIECGKCIEHCRFGAINEFFNIKPASCEGCGVCEFICPENAIHLEDRKSGYAYNSESRFGPMAHARLWTAEEASGKLVTLVRNNARNLAHENSKDLIIIDGPPGIGCPVIAAISGVNLVLVVTEPTLSGISDLERVLNVTQHFKIPAMVCVNKYDINIENTEKIEQYCEENGIQVVGRIPYDNITTMAMIDEKSVIEYSDGKLSDIIRYIWINVKGEIT